MKWLLAASALAVAAQAQNFGFNNGSSNGTIPGGTATGLGTSFLPTGTGTAVGVSTVSANGTSSTPTPVPSGPRVITAHADGQCVKSLNAPNTTLVIDQGFPNFTTVSQPQFPGAEAPNGGGGYNVWFSFPDPGAGCRNMMMVPYSQNRGTPGYPGGKEIINAGHGGCYFANVPANADLLLSFCCGVDNCASSSLNSSALLSSPTKKRGLLGSNTEIKREPKREAAAMPEAVEIKREAEAAPAVAADALDAPASGSLFSRAKSMLDKRFYYPPPPSFKNCTYHAGQPFSQAGPQVIVTSGQSCPTNPCTIAVAAQVSFSTTATSSKTQTLTSTDGLSVSFQAGVNFLGEEASFTTSFDTSFSIAVATATGTDVMNGNSTTITNTESFQLGNLGAVTFTPIYKCFTGPLDCGGGLSDPIQVCQPDLSPINHSLQGEYNAVVYG